MIKTINSPEQELIQEIIEDFYQILREGYDINKTDEGYTILIDLAWAGRIDLVKLAVKLGADVNAVSHDRSFALSQAARQGWQDVYNYLAPLTAPNLREIAEKEIDNGLIYRKRKDNHFVETFIKAASNGDIDTIRQAISDSIDINAIGSKGVTALYTATSMNQLSVVQLLLESGADPNLKKEDSRGCSPLMICLSDRKIDYEIFQKLLEAGADINAASSEGQTVLMFAVLTWNMQSGLKAVKQLLKLGVDVNAKDINGCNALDYAKETRKMILPEYKEPSEIIRLLEK